MNTTGWGRRRLLGILAGAIVAALVLVAGLGYAVLQVVAPAGNQGRDADVPGVARGGGLPPSSATGQELRDEIAAAPMLSVPKEAMEQSEKATEAAPLSVPSGTRLGAANVLMGFPQTPEGAAGQLAQLEVTVLQAMSLATTQQVYDAWAMPAGPGVEGWGLARAVGAFLDSTGMVEAKDPSITVRVQPAALLIKGTDGADWVTACVLTRISASFRAQGEVAYGYCERMQWHGGRWMIAPGSVPAPAPSTWPGTQLAIEAGWRTWVSEGLTADAPPAGDNLGAGARRGPAVAIHVGPGHVQAVGAGVGARVGPGAGAALGIDIIPDLPNPLGELGEVIAKAAAQGWTEAMLALWNAGLFVLRVALVYTEKFLTPDLGENGPGRVIYEYAFWMSGALVLVMTLIQLGVAAFKREGKSLARALIGGAQFVVVCFAWLGYCVAFLAACTGLNGALLKALLGVNTVNEWDPLGGFEDEDVTDAAVATVLGLLGCVVWLAALGHILIMLARAASLMVLVATGPVAAAGLVSDVGRSWFWKSLRWFHAAAFTPVLMVLVLGIGVQFTTGVAAGMSDTSTKAIATALPGVMLLCVSCVAPMALFKLLAFVDPGTPSGSSFRQGMAMSGGLQGLMSGGGSGGGSEDGSSAATQADDSGRSAGEGNAETSTSDRFGKSGQGMLAAIGGGVGGVMAAGMGIVSTIGTKGASLLGDETNQAGVGHHTYGPDFSSLQDRDNNSNNSNNQQRSSSEPADDDTGSPPPPPRHPRRRAARNRAPQGPAAEPRAHRPAALRVVQPAVPGAVPREQRERCRR
ncbi:type IV secretion system protein [Nocardioides sp. InS609-2]|uniref:type IV secretion system protein n=1 Tax=Nocardioides sp. InS609-2 TaxID=2760705 RepID=UPI0020BE1E0A|nr:type IV secretion system protein [Nocardioides sp. InS609-2]